MKTLLAFLFTLGFACHISFAETKEPGQPLDVSIAAYQTYGEEKILASDKKSLPAFDVVITNISPLHYPSGTATICGAFAASRWSMLTPAARARSSPAIKQLGTATCRVHFS
ncbi:MAG: hypothetical protein WCD79_19495 [Chthoniobacteraceae bacterium]